MNITDEEPITLLESYERNRINGKLINTIKIVESFIHSSDDITKLKIINARNNMMGEIHKIMLIYPEDTIHITYHEIIHKSNIYLSQQYKEVVCSYYLLPG